MGDPGQRAGRRAARWVVEATDGLVPIEFEERNDVGVADHTVTLDGSLRVTNAIRVLPNGDSAEVTFTLFQRPNVSNTEFEADATTVQSDLDTLKRVLESRRV